MKQALVTGSTGFVGANLVRLLLKRDYRVKVLVRPTSDLRNIDRLNVEKVVGDLKDAGSVSRAAVGCEEIYHVAAEYAFWSANPESMYQSNIQGTKNVMEAALQTKAKKVVYTSTVGTIGLSAQPNACNEETPMESGQLTSHYKKSKLEAERVALSYLNQGVPLVVVNPSAPIGPWDRKPTPTGKMIVDCVLGKMPAYVESGLNLVHVEDVCEGHLLAAQKGRIGERYILGNQNMSLGEIFSQLAEITGRAAPKFKIPYGVAWMSGFVSTKFSDWVTHKPPAIALEAVKMAKRHMYFDSSKALRELGLPQTSVRKALEDAVSWFAENEYLGNNQKRFEIKSKVEKNECQYR